MMKTMYGALRVGILGGVFAAGYVFGVVTQPEPAEAQVGDLMKKAGEMSGSGPLETAAKLGTSISEMQKNVDSLQQQLGTLNEIKAALGGG
jgi:hypothetical protein